MPIRGRIKVFSEDSRMAFYLFFIDNVFKFNDNLSLTKHTKF